MASLSGYNPNVSLLPSAGGVIQPMSGGAVFDMPQNYNPNNSLLPASGGDIASYQGGFYEDSVVVGGEGRSRAQIGLQRAAQAREEAAARLKSQGPLPAVTNRNIPTTESVINVSPSTPVPAPSNLMVPSIEPDVNVVTQTQPATAKPIVPMPKTNYTIPTEPIVNSTVPSNIKPNKEEDKSIKKNIILFGTPLSLENPKNNTDNPLSGDQLEALKLFGLDGSGLSDREKRDIVQALYDGKCNTDKPLIMLNNCEPIRRVVQSLALNLLARLEPDSKGEIPGIVKEEKPEVNIEKKNDGSMSICLLFKPNQLHILSKFSSKLFKENEKNKKAGEAVKQAMIQREVTHSISKPEVINVGVGERKAENVEEQPIGEILAPELPLDSKEKNINLKLENVGVGERKAENVEEQPIGEILAPELPLESKEKNINLKLENVGVGERKAENVEEQPIGEILAPELLSKNNKAKNLDISESKEENMEEESLADRKKADIGESKEENNDELQINNISKPNKNSKNKAKNINIKVDDIGIGERNAENLEEQPVGILPMPNINNKNKNKTRKKLENNIINDKENLSRFSRYALGKNQNNKISFNQFKTRKEKKNISKLSETAEVPPVEAAIPPPRNIVPILAKKRTRLPPVPPPVPSKKEQPTNIYKNFTKNINNITKKNNTNNRSIVSKKNRNSIYSNFTKSTNKSNTSIKKGLVLNRAKAERFKNTVKKRGLTFPPKPSTPPPNTLTKGLDFTTKNFNSPATEAKLRKIIDLLRKARNELIKKDEIEPLAKRKLLIDNIHKDSETIWGAIYSKQQTRMQHIMDEIKQKYQDLRVTN